jgi:hypothetical protein
MLQFGDRFGFRTRHLHVPCPALARPLKLLHLSDAHVCEADRAKRRFIQRVTDDDYDFVFFTGDITEEDGAEHLVPELLSRAPRHGAYAVLGNHDYVRQSFWVSLKEALTRKPDPTLEWSDGPALKAAMEAGGRWKVLINESVEHEIEGRKVVIAGVDDPYTDHGDLQRTMQRVKKADVLIGLVHVPTDLASFSQRGFHLVLAGHTHGGQIRLPLVGALKTQCDLPARLAMGLHWVERTAVHVSAGLGAGKLVRARLLCPPTAYVITLGGPAPARQG